MFDFLIIFLLNYFWASRFLFNISFKKISEPSRGVPLSGHIFSCFVFLVFCVLFLFLLFLFSFSPQNWFWMKPFWDESVIG